MRRRRFFGAGLGVAVCGTIGCGARGGGAYWRFFTQSEAETVDAICERLIPADRDPGAKQARVVCYIDRQLKRHLRKSQPVYRQGIAAVEEAGRARFNRRFVELEAVQQVEILEGIEKSAKGFFELILNHARQGFYGDPRHGGNYEMASWKMIGLPFPQIRGRRKDG